MRYTYGDTVELVGDDVTPLSTTAAPSTRTLALLTYDASRGRVVLLSGTANDEDPIESSIQAGWS